ncbi:MAG: glycerol-3-phosphate responsive antiterminator [Vallitalea sp.]|jgi:glycerol uptake operon antiterminator|nr:glycerol-3-phosphate responsive antiterminator [Vallitalea sp.]
MDLMDFFIDNPIIAAVNSDCKLNEALSSPSNIIFLLYGDIFNLETNVNIIKKHNKKVFVHFDLIKGFSSDSCSLKYVHEKIQPDGIITTKSTIVKKAKSLNFFVIQRLFVLDSLSIDTGIHSVKSVHPDAIEIMPGIVPKITKIISNTFSVPIICGGLINQKKEIIDSLGAGATCVSTSCAELWYS